MSFENLAVWKKSSRLCVEIYKELNQCRNYGFRDQLTRAALSLPSNIAEGMDRQSGKETCRFLSIAKGSAEEMRTQIYIGMEAGFIPQQTGQRWITASKEISAMIEGLKKSFKL